MKSKSAVMGSVLVIVAIVLAGWLFASGRIGVAVIKQAEFTVDVGPYEVASVKCIYTTLYTATGTEIQFSGSASRGFSSVSGGGMYYAGLDPAGAPFGRTMRTWGTQSSRGYTSASTGNWVTAECARRVSG